VLRAFREDGSAVEAEVRTQAVDDAKAACQEADGDEQQRVRQQGVEREAGDDCGRG
jgi:hypothetical protein